METFVLNNIRYQPNLDQLREKLHTDSGTPLNDDLEKLAAEAQAIAKPKGLYGTAFVDSKEDTSVTTEGITFRSRVLRVNLDNVHRVFPYAATGGTELEAWARTTDGALQAYIADMIVEQALEIADYALGDHIQERYRPGTLSEMHPGSLADWPIEEQRPLFKLLGDTKRTIGVELNDSLMMIPTKSLSGIRFASDRSFVSCQLCPKENCRDRRSPYDPGLYEKRYSLK